MKSEPIVKRNVVQVVRCEIGSFTLEELLEVQQQLLQRERSNRRVFSISHRKGDDDKLALIFFVLHGNLRSTAPKDIREMVASACGWTYEDARIVIEPVAALTDIGSATPHYKSSRAGTKRKVVNKPAA